METGFNAKFANLNPYEQSDTSSPMTNMNGNNYHHQFDNIEPLQIDGNK